MKPGAVNHPKVEQLADVLGIRLREARGILEALFHLVNQYAERGDVGRFTDTQIAKRVDWGGRGEKPERLVEALLQVGWIEPHKAHRYVLHDWPEHAPDYTKRRVRGSDGKPGPGWAVDDEEPADSVEDSTSLENSGIPQKITSPLPSPLPSEPLLSSPHHTPGRASRSDGVCLAPEALDPQDLEKLVAWGSENGFTRDDCLKAWERVHDWSVTGRKQKARWWVVCKNAMQDGWALRNREPPRRLTFAEEQQQRIHETTRRLMNEGD